MLKEGRRFISTTPQKKESLKSQVSHLSPISPASPSNIQTKARIDHERLNFLSTPKSAKASPRVYYFLDLTNFKGL